MRRLDGDVRGLHAQHDHREEPEEAQDGGRGRGARRFIQGRGREADPERRARIHEVRRSFNEARERPGRAAEAFRTGRRDDEQRRAVRHRAPPAAEAAARGHGPVAVGALRRRMYEVARARAVEECDRSDHRERFGQPVGRHERRRRIDMGPDDGELQPAPHRGVDGHGCGCPTSWGQRCCSWLWRSDPRVRGASVIERGAAMERAAPATAPPVLRLPRGLLALYTLGALEAAVPLVAQVQWLDAHGVGQAQQLRVFALGYACFSLRPVYGAVADALAARYGSRGRVLAYVAASCGGALCHCTLAVTRSLGAFAVGYALLCACQACAETCLGARLADVVASGVGAGRAQAEATAARWLGTLLASCVGFAMYRCDRAISRLQPQRSSPRRRALWSVSSSRWRHRTRRQSQ